MAAKGYPVVFDATPSMQQPGGQGTNSGEMREFAPVLARAASAVGVGRPIHRNARGTRHRAQRWAKQDSAGRDAALIGQLRAFDDLAKAMSADVV